MEVYEAVRTILAIRAFRSKPVSDDMIRRVIESARLTGSSMNGQPWHFVVVKKRDILAEIGSIVSSGPYNAQAAFAVVVAMKKHSRLAIYEPGLIRTSSRSTSGRCAISAP